MISHKKIYILLLMTFVYGASGSEQPSKDGRPCPCHVFASEKDLSKDKGTRQNLWPQRSEQEEAERARLEALSYRWYGLQLVILQKPTSNLKSASKL